MITFTELLTLLKKRSALEDFLIRLPVGADVAVTSDSFYFTGQILNHDRTHLIISDGESIQLVKIAKIDDINYCLPDIPLEIVKVLQ